MSDEQPWMMTVSRYPPTKLGTPQSLEEDSLLMRAGYRGMTRHETREAAAAAADSVFDAVTALNPIEGWMAIWFFLKDLDRSYTRNVEGEGKCYSKRRDPRPSEGDA